jgi:hypothetical protein
MPCTIFAGHASRISSPVKQLQQLIGGEEARVACDAERVAHPQLPIPIGQRPMLRGLQADRARIAGRVIDDDPNIEQHASAGWARTPSAAGCF